MAYKDLNIHTAHIPHETVNALQDDERGNTKKKYDKTYEKKNTHIPHENVNALQDDERGKCNVKWDGE